MLLFMNKGNISLYVMAFWFPMIRNFFSYFTSCATYSRNNENGGLVTTMSASFRSSTHSALRKSPSPLSSLTHTSSSSTTRLPFLSPS